MCAFQTFEFNEVVAYKMGVRVELSGFFLIFQFFGFFFSMLVVGKIGDIAS